jgi:branched-chain amino acid aminotransferase
MLTRTNMTLTDKEIRGDFFVVDGNEKPAETFDGSLLLPGTSFYEVMRVRDKTPLFLEDHLDRLNASLQAGGDKAGPPAEAIKSSLRLLVSANRSISEGNIRLILHFPPSGNEKPAIFCHYTHHYYPSAEEYASGVALVSIHTERPRVHAKIIDPGFRLKVVSRIREANAFEAVLVNSKGYITEGSKSNIFMIRNDMVLTPPVADVLPGITRKYVLFLCRFAGIPVAEERIRFNEAGEFDSCLITGTSPGVLPVSSIDQTRYNTGHPLLRRLSAGYETIVSDYIDKNKFE